MKRAAFILIILATRLCGFGQLPRDIQFALSANGELNLSWPIEVIRPLNPKLTASYQVEVSDDFTNWTANGAILRGETFATALASVNVSQLQTKPATFVRVRTLLDFSSRDFGDARINGLRLDNANFTAVNFFAGFIDQNSFANADFTAADLRFASMTEAFAENCDFTVARLSDADLSSSDFIGSSFLLADLAGADLTFARLENTDLRGAVLEDANFTFTRLHGSKIDSQTILAPHARAIWQIVNNEGASRVYTNLDLSFTDLSHGNGANSDFSGSNLTGGDLTFTDISGANLGTSQLDQVDWRGAIIDDKTVLPAKFWKIWQIVNVPEANRDLTATDLTQCFWIEVDLQEANLTGAQLDFGVFFDCDFFNVTAEGADFTSVQFHGADLRQVNFRNANLRNASFDGVNLTGADLTGAILIGTTFANSTMPDGSHID